MEVRFGKITIVEGPGIKPTSRRFRQEVARTDVMRVLEHTDATGNPTKITMLTGKHLAAILKRLNLKVGQDVDFTYTTASYKPHLMNHEFLGRLEQTIKGYVQEQEAAGEKVHRIQVEA